MDPKKHAELVSFGFPQHIIHFLEGFTIDNVEVTEIIEFLQQKGILSVEEGKGTVTFSFLDEHSLRGRIAKVSEPEKEEGQDTLPGSATLQNDLLGDEEPASCGSYEGDPPRGLPARHEDLNGLAGSDRLQDDFIGEVGTECSGGYVREDPPAGHPARQGVLTPQRKDLVTLPGQALQSGARSVPAGVKPASNGGPSVKAEHTTSSGVYAGGVPPHAARVSSDGLAALPGSDRLQDDFIGEVGTECSGGYVREDPPAGHPARQGVLTPQRKDLVTLPGQALQSGARSVPAGVKPASNGGPSVKAEHTTSSGVYAGGVPPHAARVSSDGLAALPGSDWLQDDFIGEVGTECSGGYVREDPPAGHPARQGVLTPQRKDLVTLPGQALQSGARSVPAGVKPASNGGPSVKAEHTTSSGVYAGGVPPHAARVSSDGLAALPGSDWLQDDFIGEVGTECSGGYVREDPPAGHPARQGVLTPQRKDLVTLPGQALQSGARSVPAGVKPASNGGPSVKAEHTTSSGVYAGGVPPHAARVSSDGLAALPGSDRLQDDFIGEVGTECSGGYVREDPPAGHPARQGVLTPQRKDLVTLPGQALQSGARSVPAGVKPASNGGPSVKAEHTTSSGVYAGGVPPHAARVSSDGLAALPGSDWLQDDFIGEVGTECSGGYVREVPPAGHPARQGVLTPQRKDLVTLPGQALQSGARSVPAGVKPASNGGPSVKAEHTTSSGVYAGGVPPHAARVSSDGLAALPGSDWSQDDFIGEVGTECSGGYVREDPPAGHPARQGVLTPQRKDLVTLPGQALQSGARSVPAGVKPASNGGPSVKAEHTTSSGVYAGGVPPHAARVSSDGLAALPGSDRLQDDFIGEVGTECSGGYVREDPPAGHPARQGVLTPQRKDLVTLLGQALQSGARSVPAGVKPASNGGPSVKAEHTTSSGVYAGGVPPHAARVSSDGLAALPGSDWLQDDFIGEVGTECSGGYVREDPPAGHPARQGVLTPQRKDLVTLPGQALQSGARSVPAGVKPASNGGPSVKAEHTTSSGVYAGGVPPHAARVSSDGLAALPGSDRLQDDFIWEEGTECSGGYVSEDPLAGHPARQGVLTPQRKDLVTLSGQALQVVIGDQGTASSNAHVGFSNSNVLKRKRNLASISTQNVSSPRKVLTPVSTNIDQEPKPENIQTSVSQRLDSENLQVTTSELTPNVLRDVLQRKLDGRAILDLASTGPLSDKRQSDLAGIIAEWHLENRTKVYAADLRKYAIAITSLFIHEKEETYYLPRGGDKKNPGGKIYSSINNTKTKKKKQAKDDQRQRDLNASDGTYCETTDGEDEAQLDALKWLQDNDEPWTTVREYWKAIFPLRRRYVGTVKAKAELVRCNLWRLCSSRLGYQLIDIDYQLMVSKRSNGKWEHVMSVAGPYIKQRSTDDLSERLVTVLNNKSASNDSRLCALLLVLNCVLPPPKVTKTYKPPVLNGQKDTIIFAQNDEDAQTKLGEVYAEYNNYGMPITPKIVLFGNQFELTGIFRVYYEDLYYTLPTVARAVDVYIKWVMVLGLKHSKISKLIWLFIQQYIYDHDVKEQYASIIKFIDYLNRSTPASHHED